MAFPATETRVLFTMSTTNSGFWSGIAEVVPRAGNDLLGGADGAYVGTVGLAATKAAFLKNSKVAFDAMGFDLLEIHDSEFIRSIEDWTSADEIMLEKAASLTSDNPIECGPFHCFRDSDE